MRNIRLGKVKKGFTLVELLIVIIIIAVLAAIAIPKFANSSTRSKESSLRSNLKILRDATELFKADTGCYPKELADLALAQPAAGNLTGFDSKGGNCTITASDARGPYLQAIPNDPIANTTTWTYYTTAPGPIKISSTSTDPTYSTW